jgi:riboflavin biosynthesis pyrimidine reductase
VLSGLDDLADLDDAALAERYAVDRDRPWLRANFVTSLDGAAAAADGLSAGLSDPQDKRVFAMLRMLCDALLVGAGTFRKERYRPLRLDEPRRRWRTARGLSPFPRLVVVSGSLDLDPAQSALADAPIRPIVLTCETAPAHRRDALAPVADVLVFGEREVDLPGALDVLRRTGLPQILSEGGPQLLGRLTAHDLVDELCLSLSPQLVGPGPGRITAGPPTGAARHLRLTNALRAGDLLILRYTRP